MLLDVGGGDGAPDICFLNLKEAVKAAAPSDPKAEMPRDNAERIVAGVLALSPNLGPRTAACRLLGKSVVVRELMPQDMKIELVGLSPDEAWPRRNLVRVVADAEGRQTDAAARLAWLDYWAATVRDCWMRPLGWGQASWSRRPPRKLSISNIAGAMPGLDV